MELAKSRERKLKFSIFAVGVIVLMGGAAAIWASVVPIYETLVGGVVAVAGLYLAGNVMNKAVASKANKTDKSDE